MKLDSKQMLAVSESVAMAETGGVLKVMGKAGTGKTTVGKEIVFRLIDLGYDVRCVAYTNKAVDRMVQVGYPRERCTTLNRLLYTTVMGVEVEGYEFSDDDADKILRGTWTAKNAAELDAIFDKAGVYDKESEDHRPLRRRVLGSIQSGRGDRKSVYMLKEEKDLKKDGLSSKTVLVVDEMSMVPLDMADDTHAVFKTVIFLGDPGQLPPVNSVDTCKYLGADKEIVLENVHRVEENSDILDKVYELDAGRIPGCAKPISMKEFDTLAKDGYQFICYTNKAVAWINDRKRQVMGLAKMPPQEGEPLIAVTGFRAQRTVPITPENFNWFTKNELRLTERFEHSRGRAGAIYNRKNGELQSVTLIRMIQKSSTFTASGEPEPTDGDLWLMPFTLTDDPEKRVWICRTLPFWEMSLAQRTSFRKVGKSMRIEFGHAITGHKSQGSEYPKVAVMLRRSGRRESAEEREEISRWNYTAGSRARSELKIFTSIIGCQYG